MGSVAFIELEQVLSSQKEPLTPQEANVFGRCNYKAFRGFLEGLLAGGATAWAVTRKLQKLPQVAVTAGAAWAVGLWRFDRSLGLCLGDLLALDGTRIQKELANILMKKYQHDSSVMQLMCRHFYPETVFDDSTSELPTLRWRYRSFFSDTVVHGEKAHQNDSQGDVHAVPRNDLRSKKADVKSKYVAMNQSASEEDLLDGIFGYAMAMEEIDHPGGSSTPAKVLTRSHKRSHRRRHQRHHEVSSDLKHVQAQQI